MPRYVCKRRQASAFVPTTGQPGYLREPDFDKIQLKTVLSVRLSYVYVPDQSAAGRRYSGSPPFWVQYAGRVLVYGSQQLRMQVEVVDGFKVSR